MNDMKKLTFSYDHIACLWILDGQEQEWKQEEHLGNQHRHPTSSKATVGAHGDELQETWPDPVLKVELTGDAHGLDVVDRNSAAQNDCCFFLAYKLNG